MFYIGFLHHHQATIPTVQYCHFVQYNYLYSAMWDLCNSIQSLFAASFNNVYSLCVCVCKFLYLHLSKDQCKFLTNGVRSFLGSEDILAGPQNVFRLFEG